MEPLIIFDHSFLSTLIQIEGLCYLYRRVPNTRSSSTSYLGLGHQMYFQYFSHVYLLHLQILSFLFIQLNISKDVFHSHQRYQFRACQLKSLYFWLFTYRSLFLKSISDKDFRHSQRLPSKAPIIHLKFDSQCEFQAIKRIKRSDDYP